LDSERCILSVSSATITNSIRILKCSDYIEINNINYFIENNSTNLSPVTFSVVLDEVLPNEIEVHLDYCNNIYFQSLDYPLVIHDMSYNMSLYLGIKLYQLCIASIEVNYEEIYTL
jgi:type VI protein secretion system component Hcp